MKSVLILYPANIISHLIPALNVANHLKNDYDIYVLILDPNFEGLVKSHGFCPLILDPLRIAMGNEMFYLKNKGRKYSLFNIILTMLNNDFYHDRVSEIKHKVGNLAPVGILVDIFHSMESLVLRSVFPKAAIMCLNPMLSTYKIDGFPTVSERSWTTANSKSLKIHQKWQSFRDTPSLSGILLRWAYRVQIKRLLEITTFGNKIKIAHNSTYTPLFDKVPELILSPLELELDASIKLPTQQYMGLCINIDRIDLGVHEDFNAVFRKLTLKRDKGSKIVYCSFGTFYLDSDPTVLQFLKSLVLAILALPESVEVIFSIKPQIMKTLQHQVQLPANIHFFSKVPQLQILKNADLHITHGGLGSIKESIYYEVPMLVYPLDLRYDQNGNGLKVEYHKIGLRGVFNQDKTETVTAKIEQILYDNTFKDRISHFHKTVKCNYPDSIISDTITKLICQHESI